MTVLIKKVAKDGANQQWLPMSEHQDAALNLNPESNPNPP